MKKKIKPVLILLAVAAGGVGLFLLRSSDRDAVEHDAQIKELHNRPRPVRVEKLTTQVNTALNTYPATVQAADSVELAFRVGGPLIQVLAKPGQAVKQDDLLMQIDPRDYEDALASLKARLAGAKAALENAITEYARAESLLGDHVISQSDFDAASAQRDIQQAQVDQLEAALTIAKHALADSSLKAPFKGIVTRKYIENHEMVAPGKPVLAILDTSHLDITIHVPERDMHFQPLRNDLMAAVTILPIPNRTFAAVIKEWSVEADSEARTYAVTFSMDAPEDVQVLPGMTAEVNWSPQGTVDEQLTVPVSALLRNNGDSAVWIYDAGTQTATKKPVVTGEQVGRDRIEIISGLAPGMTVIAAGADYIQPGMKLIPLAAAGLE